MSKCKKSSTINYNGAEDDIDCIGATGTPCNFMLLTQLQIFDSNFLTSCSIFYQLQCTVLTKGSYLYSVKSSGIAFFWKSIVVCHIMSVQHASSLRANFLISLKSIWTSSNSLLFSLIVNAVPFVFSWIALAIVSSWIWALLKSTAAKISFAFPPSYKISFSWLSMLAWTIFTLARQVSSLYDWLTLPSNIILISSA